MSAARLKKFAQVSACMGIVFFVAVGGLLHLLLSDIIDHELSDGFGDEPKTTIILVYLGTVFLSLVVFNSMTWYFLGKSDFKKTIISSLFPLTLYALTLLLAAMFGYSQF